MLTKASIVGVSTPNRDPTELQVSKFGDAMGVELEPVWYGHQPVLFAAEPPSSPAARRHLEHFLSHEPAG